MRKNSPQNRHSALKRSLPICCQLAPDSGALNKQVHLKRSLLICCLLASFLLSGWLGPVTFGGQAHNSRQILAQQLLPPPTAETAETPQDEFTGETLGGDLEGENLEDDQEGEPLEDYLEGENPDEEAKPSADLPKDFSGLLEDVPRPEDAWPTLEEVGASSYIVIDADTGDVLLDYNSTAEAYPASMTKIMTALVVLEHPDFAPDRPVYFSERACAMPAAESATAGMQPGEIAPTISCLYMMMVQSANEIANALAENYGGSIEGFVDLMNQKAEELGCEHTNFLDPCGFGYVDHHTTAQDLAKITRYAMQLPLFQSLVSCKYYSMPPTNLHPMSAWSNHFNGNYLVVFQDSGYQSPWLKSIDGVKRGDTDIAGHCLASAATTYDGRHIIAILFDGVFLGQAPNYVGVIALSRTLLEEGAKRMGAPRQENVVRQEDAYYAWPSMRDPYLAEQVVEETTQETFVIPTWPEPAEAAVGEDEIVVNRLQLTLLIAFLAIFIFLVLVLTYRLIVKRRQEKLLRHYDHLHDQFHKR
ncbi:MAG: hypothetical protein Q4E09_05775 [Eubacteriales bacterium]|nr:hypothetical protein [Eubacteriales bacterium]